MSSERQYLVHIPHANGLPFVTNPLNINLKFLEKPVKLII